MKGKKIIEFLVLKPAFTSRNISSLGLVVIFFIVYWLAGGKVVIPNVKQGSNFGSVNKTEKNKVFTADTTEERLPEARPTENLNARIPSETGSTVTPPTTTTSDEKTKQLEEKLQRLNELEERLKSLKRAKSGGD
jgi:hypothetical protein